MDAKEFLEKFRQEAQLAVVKGLIPNPDDKVIMEAMIKPFITRNIDLGIAFEIIKEQMTGLMEVK